MVPSIGRQKDVADHELIAGETFVRGKVGIWALYLGPCTSDKGDMYVAYRGVVLKGFQKDVTETVPYPNPSEKGVK